MKLIMYLQNNFVIVTATFLLRTNLIRTVTAQISLKYEQIKNNI